jgi:ABC-type taurine transport system ATPase subunit
MPFAQAPDPDGIRAVKSRPDFAAAREEVLGMIWRMGRAQQPIR